MAQDPTSYKDQRRKRDGESARKGPEDEDLFFGASPTEKKALRHTKDPKKLKLAELNLDAVDRDKYGAPEKVGENIRLIDVAMSDTDPPPVLGARPTGVAVPKSGADAGKATRRAGRPPAPTQPARQAPPAKRKRPKAKPEPEARRTPSDYVPTGEQGEIQGKIARVQLPLRQRLERAIWALAVLITIAGMAFPYALPVLHPELAVAVAAERDAAIDPWNTPWDLREVGAFSLGPDGVASADDLQRPEAHSGSLADWASWGREAALFAAGALVWLALTLSLTLDLRSPSRVVEGGRALLLASLPALLGSGVVAWGADAGQAYGVPDPPARVHDAVGSLIELSASFPVHAALPWIVCWSGLCLLVAAGLRRSRPLRQVVE